MKENWVKLKKELWRKLVDIFRRYEDRERGEIPVSQLPKVVGELLDETSESEVEYVMKNLFRIDIDANGWVSMQQFGNFLLKRHCGEMSLQKMHKTNKIKNGSSRKIALMEFIELLNSAFAFLSINCNFSVMQSIFAQFDKDQDGLINYAEYFGFTEKYLCLSNLQYEEFMSQFEGAPIRHTNSPEVKWESRIKNFLWTEFKKRYEEWKVEGTKPEIISKFLHHYTNIQCSSLVEQLSKNEEMLNDFDQLVCLMMRIIGDFKMEEYRSQNPTITVLSRQNFLTLLNQTYKFLSIFRIKTSFLFSLFKLIDSESKDFITYQQYRSWLHNHLCSKYNESKHYYLEEDDLKLGQHQIVEEEARRSRMKYFFSSYSLSQQVRKRMYERLLPFASIGWAFEEKNIKRALVEVLKQNEEELDYSMRNVFKYDLSTSKKLTLPQFVNFCVEQHFGEMAIKRLHRKEAYSRGSQQLMNELEFAMTLNNALSHIDIEASKEQIETIFSELNQSDQKWMSYEKYFLFLKEYFGTLSPNGMEEFAGEEQNISQMQEINTSTLKGVDEAESEVGFEEKPPNAPLSVTDDEWNLIQHIWISLRKHFQTFFGPSPATIHNTTSFLMQNFPHLTEKQLIYVHELLFNKEQQKTVQFDQFAHFILCFLGEAGLKKFHSKQIKGKSKLTISEFCQVCSDVYQLALKWEPTLQLIYTRISGQTDLKYHLFLGWCNRALARKFN